jgi:hypothetical protein
LRSATSTMRSISWPWRSRARASTSSGTFIASSANGGPWTRISGLNCSASWPVNLRRICGHCIEPSGSPPVWSGSARSRPGASAASPAAARPRPLRCSHCRRAGWTAEGAQRAGSV